MNKHEKLYEKIFDYYHSLKRGDKLKLMYLKNNWSHNLCIEKGYNFPNGNDIVILGSFGGSSHYATHWDILHGYFNRPYLHTEILSDWTTSVNEKEAKGENELLELIKQMDYEFIGFVELNISNLIKGKTDV